MPRPLPALDRRRVLTGAGLLALLALATPACGSAPAPPDVDGLESQRQLARHDSELATAAGAALAGSASSGIIPVLTEVARERSEHVRVLTKEIARVTGKPAPSATATAATTTAAGGAAPDTAAPSVSDVVDALHSAADSAGKLAVASSGYRAGLFASIAAACTAACTVALADPA